MRPVVTLIAAWLVTACIPLDDRDQSGDIDDGDGGSWDLGLDTGASSGGADGDGGDADGGSPDGGDTDGGTSGGGDGDAGTSDGGADDGGADDGAADDGGSTGGGDTGGGSTDGGDTDGGASDGGDTDGGGADGGTSDGGTSDGGTSDGGTSDGGDTDGGSSDGGTTDGGTSDGGTSDGGTSDGGTSDGGTSGSVDNDGDGWTVEAGDCNDDDARIYPDAPETCDGVDEDCDDSIDEDFLDAYETNDSLDAAYDLGELSGELDLEDLTLTGEDDEDWFIFDAEDSIYDNVELEISAELPSTGSYLLELYMIDGSTVTLQDSDAGSGSLTVSYEGDILDDDEDDWAVRITSTTWDEDACTAGYEVVLER